MSKVKRQEQQDIELLRKKIRARKLDEVFNIFMKSKKWDGADMTPEAERYIMKKFWSTGTISAFDLSNFGLVFAPYSVSGYGLYDVPIDLNVINERNVPGFPTRLLKNNEEIVIGYYQDNRKPVVENVLYYIERIVQVEMVINTNLNLHKIPFLVTLDESDKMHCNNLIKSILNDELVVFTTTSELTKIQALVTNAPYIIDKLYSYEQNLWCDLLTYLGIDNSQVDVDKLAVDQINANNQIINGNADGFLRNLQIFCDKVKEVLGYNITVENTMKPVQSVHEEMDHSNSNMEDKQETGGTL